MGIFIALGVSLGFALITVPNVELITATVFISGYLMGIKEGAVVGCLTEALYSLLNPLGMAAPPLLIAQVLSMGIAGSVGGVLRMHRTQPQWMHHLQLGLAGFALTAMFAVLTTLSFIFFIEFSQRTLIGSFVYGFGFYAVHILSNTLIFLSIVPTIIRVSEKAR